MSFLQIHGLAKRYGAATALGGIDLDVAKGTRTAVVGPSGCGKTTLLRLIAGFEAPDSGRITLDGDVLADGAAALPAFRRGVGVVAQDGALFPHLSIAENIGFGMDRREAGLDKKIAELAYTVGLDAAVLRRRPHELSGGQQQRVALARALARKPRLMLLDEPFSALDTSLRASMRKVVAELLEGAGVTTILVTHDQAEALSFATQVAVMREGRFAQVGSPRDLYFRPKDAMIANFLGDAVLLPARLGQGFADCAMGRVGIEATGQREAARIMLRPEQIELEPVPREAALARADGLHTVFGEVRELEFAGSFSVLSIRLLDMPDAPAAAIGHAPLVLRRPFADGIDVGTFVRIRINGRAHLLR